MSPRQLLDAIPLKVVVLIVTAVLAFAQLQAQVMRKADREDVELLNRKLDVVVGALCMQPPPQVRYACGRLGTVK